MLSQIKTGTQRQPDSTLTNGSFNFLLDSQQLKYQNKFNFLMFMETN